jgi:hypothetical protein
MSDTKQGPNAPDERQQSEDVEGHNMWIGPTVSRDLARSRSKDVEREARERQRAKEAKGR